MPAPTESSGVRHPDQIVVFPPCALAGAIANEHGVDFYPAGTGISHQVMVEQGYVVPGAMVSTLPLLPAMLGAVATLGLLEA